MVTQKSNKSKHQELLMAPVNKKAGSDCLYIFLIRNRMSLLQICAITNKNENKGDNLNHNIDSF